LGKLANRNLVTAEFTLRYSGLGLMGEQVEFLQMTCRDRNRIAMQGDLLGASALGIRNILALRGDDPPADQEPAPKPVFDMDARELIEVATKMTQDGVCGIDRPIMTRPQFFMGAADTPLDPLPDWRPAMLFPS